MMRSLVVVELNERWRDADSLFRACNSTRLVQATRPLNLPKRRRSVDLDEPGFEVVIYDDIVTVALVTMPVAHLQNKKTTSNIRFMYRAGQKSGPKNKT